MRRFGGFMRDVWYLASPYLRSEEKWSAYGLLAVVLAADFLLVQVSVVLNTSNGALVNAFQQYDQPAFLRLLLTYESSPDGFFGIIPGFVPVIAVALLILVNGRYLRQWLQIRWRRWLTAHYQAEWLSGRAYYRIGLQTETLGNDNPDQRIAEDIASFVESGLVLGFGLITTVVSLVSFLRILWKLSFPIAVFGVSIPAYLVWVALLYSVIGTLLAQLIGRPLVGLSFIRQRLEADFRYALVRLRENAEGIALYNGEADESRILSRRFSAIVANWRSIMSRNRLVNAFTYFYSSVAGIFPFVAAAPLYFAKQFSYGTLVRVVGAFGEVQASASWVVDNYGSLADWASTVSRLSSFGRTLDAMQASQGAIAVISAAGQDYAVRNLHLELPNQSVLLDGVSFQLQPGSTTVLRGRSGTGKSTLFRAIAGIWPFGHGTVERPAGTTLFLPQKPYIPLGTLRRAVTYPADIGAYPQAAIAAALADAGLGRLVEELDVDMAWAQRLSGGEQQRLALARALLLRPDWLFMDEATANLDPQGEAEMYDMLRQRLPDTGVVAITHRPDAAESQGSQLVLERSGGTGASALSAAPAQ